MQKKMYYETGWEKKILQSGWDYRRSPEGMILTPFPWLYLLCRQAVVNYSFIIKELSVSCEMLPANDVQWYCTVPARTIESVCNDYGVTVEWRQKVKGHDEKRFFFVTHFKRKVANHFWCQYFQLYSIRTLQFLRCEITEPLAPSAFMSQRTYHSYKWH